MRVFRSFKFPSELIFINDVFPKNVFCKYKLTRKFEGQKNRDFCQYFIFISNLKKKSNFVMLLHRKKKFLELLLFFFFRIFESKKNPYDKI